MSLRIPADFHSQRLIAGFIARQNKVRALGGHAPLPGVSMLEVHQALARGKPIGAPVLSPVEGTPRADRPVRDLEYVQRTRAAMLAPLLRGEPCNPKAEFPNFFEGMPFARERLTEAIQSVLWRLGIPTLLQQLPGSFEGAYALKMHEIFPELQSALDRRDPSVRAVAGGGMVRATIGLLYARMYEGALNGVLPERTLDGIIHATDPLTALQVRGLGSDIDLYLVNATVFFDVMKQALTSIVSGLFDRLKPYVTSSATLKKVMLPLADILSYEEEVEASRRQGGCSLDWLAFDVMQGRILEPPGHSGIIDKLLAGRIEYLPPEPGCAIQDPAKQTIRGLRVLLEVPFGEIEGDRIPREVERLEQAQAAGGVFSHRVFDQLDKLVRNHRCGSTRRFQAAAEGSFDARVAQVLNRLGPKPLPRFLPRFPLDDARKLAFERLATHGDPPADTLVVEQAQRRLQARVDLACLPAACRGGPPVEAHALGDGVVLTASTLESAPEGGPVDVPVRLRPDARLLDLTKLEAFPSFKDRLLGPSGIGLERLVREHGVDGLWDGTRVLLQNAEAATMPSGRFDLAAILGHRLLRPPDDVPVEQTSYDFGRKVTRWYPSAWDAAAAEYFPLHALAHGAGEALDAPSPREYLAALASKPELRVSVYDRARLARMYMSGKYVAGLHLPPAPETVALPSAKTFLKTLCLRGEPVGLTGFGSLDALMNECRFSPTDVLDVLLHGWDERMRQPDPWSALGELLSWKGHLAPTFAAALRSGTPEQQQAATATHARLEQALRECTAKLAEPSSEEEWLHKLEVYAGLRLFYGPLPEHFPHPPEPLSSYADAALDACQKDDQQHLMAALRTFGALRRAEAGRPLSEAEQGKHLSPRHIALTLVWKLSKSTAKAPCSAAIEDWSDNVSASIRAAFHDETGIAGVASSCGLNVRDLTGMLDESRWEGDKRYPIAEAIWRRAEHEHGFCRSLLFGNERLGQIAQRWMRHSYHRRAMVMMDMLIGEAAEEAHSKAQTPGFEGEVLIRFLEPERWRDLTARGFRYQAGTWERGS